MEKERTMERDWQPARTRIFPHRRIYRSILQSATIALCPGLPFSRRIWTANETFGYRDTVSLSQCRVRSQRRAL